MFAHLRIGALAHLRIGALVFALVLKSAVYARLRVCDLSCLACKFLGSNFAIQCYWNAQATFSRVYAFAIWHVSHVKNINFCMSNMLRFLNKHFKHRMLLPDWSLRELYLYNDRRQYFNIILYIYIYLTFWYTWEFSNILK